jgi:hypothetical protein
MELCFFFVLLHLLTFIMKRKEAIVLVALGCFLAFGCTKPENRQVVVRGNIENLGKSPLYVSYYQSIDVLAYDTIWSTRSGSFEFKARSCDEISPVTIYFKNRKCWTTLFAEPGDHVSIKGNIEFVDLLNIHGGVTNDDLNTFKNQIRNLYMERLSLLKEKDAAEEPSQERLAEINLLLKRKAKEYIREKPASIASVVLIQDFFYQDYDPITRDLLGLLEGDARNSHLANRIREGVQKW